MLFVFGLGNPGKEYLKTRHNVGFLSIDEISKKFRISLKNHRFKSIYGKREIFGKSLFIVKPLTYMNRSGESVKEWVKNEKISPQNLLIIYDDIDLPLGQIRIRKKGSGGSHNGMNSIIFALQTENIPRIRIGIGTEYKPKNLADYVLSEFEEKEFSIIMKTISLIPDIIADLLRRGIDYSMSKYNKKSLLADESAG